MRLAGELVAHFEPLQTQTRQEGSEQSDVLRSEYSVGDAIHYEAESGVQMGQHLTDDKQNYKKNKVDFQIISFFKSD